MREHSAPALSFSADILLCAQGIKLMFLDVDGVLTDGGLYFQECPSGDERDAAETIKRFHTLDGFGLKLLQQAGVMPVVITGRDSRPLRARLRSLGVTHAYFGVERKLSVATRVLAEVGVRWDETAAMGDDWPDLPILERCALPCAPPNAHIEVKSRSRYVTAVPGGHGAVREVADLLLVASGRYAALLEEFSG